MSNKTFFIFSLAVIICLAGGWALFFYFSPDFNTHDARVNSEANFTALRFRIERGEPFARQPEPEPEQPPEVEVQHQPGRDESQEPADRSLQIQSKVPELKDKILTPDFIEDLAETIFEHYLPQEKKLTLTFKQINMRYGLYFYGLDYMGDDVLQIRREIFGHLLRPFIIDRLSPVVAGNLTKKIVDIASGRPKEFTQGSKKVSRTLKRSEVAELLTLLARKVRDISNVFVDYAQNKDVDKLMKEYFQAEELLKQAYFHYWQLKEKEHGQMEVLGRKIKQGIVEREKIKGQIRAVLTSSSGQRESSEVLYIAKWIYRRIKTDKVSRDVIEALGQAGLAWARQLEKKVQEMSEE